jgi:hypothetical protein
MLRNYKQVSKPTPLPDVIEENEAEFPVPQSNQPILVIYKKLKKIYKNEIV